MPMLRPYSRLCAALFAATALFLLVPPARAQTGAALLVKPWPDKDELFDGRADGYFLESGHIKHTDESFHFSEYLSEGRFRVLPGNEISPRVGYDFTFLDNHSGDPRVPRQLTDVSVAVGTGIFKKNDWIGAITLGGGYAGDKPFGEGDGWFLKSDFVLVKQLPNDDFLGFILDYDGNRAYFPDLPLPGIGYSHRFDPKLQAVIGLPYTSVSWKPIDRLDIEFEYALLTDIRTAISYEFIRHWNVYTSYDYQRDAFHVSNLGKDRRLLFIDHRVEAGLRFNPTERWSFHIGVGYSFNGEYRRGFDFQDSHPVLYFSDEPYLRVGLEGRF